MQEPTLAQGKGTTIVFLSKATFCWLLSRGLAYPGDDLRDQGRLRGFARGLLRAVEAMDAGPGVLAAAQGLQEALESAPKTPLGLDEEYTYLFERGLRCPPYGSRYTVHQDLRLGQEIADVASLYALFGLQIGCGEKELPDHVSVEWEFLSFLYAKETYALEHGWSERAQVCQEVRRCFLNEHLGRWFHAFAERVQKFGRHPFYPALVRVGTAFLDAEIATLRSPAQGE